MEVDDWMRFNVLLMIVLSLSSWTDLLTIVDSFFYFSLSLGLVLLLL